MAARKFDKSAAFKSIIGADHTDDDQNSSPESKAFVAQSSSVQYEDETPTTPQRNTPLVIMPNKREARDQRRQVILTKTLAMEVDDKVKTMGLSFNEVVNQLLQLWAKEG